MDIIEAIFNRRSMRDFKPDPIPHHVIEEILDACRWAPSGGNAQPWYILILEGEKLVRLRAKLEEKMETSWDGTKFTDAHSDLPRSSGYSKLLMPRVESQRGPMYESLYETDDSIEMRQNKLHKYLKKRLRFFDAPTVVIMCSEDPNATAVLGVGIVTQTFCLAAHAHGLGTCIMGLTVEWPEIYRELLDIPQDKYIVTSVAVGYPNLDTPINNFRRSRETVNTLSKWYTDLK